MDVPAIEPSAATQALTPTSVRGRLFRKYALLFAGIVSAALVANGLLDIWFSYREQKALLIRIQREQADAAAAKISQFVKEIEGQMGWTTQLAWPPARMSSGASMRCGCCARSRRSPSSRCSTRPAESSSRCRAWRWT